MGSCKRAREADETQDVLEFFKRERENAALRRNGPFFLERILFPRLNQLYSGRGSLVPDPTRVACEKGARSLKRHGALVLPQRVEAFAQLRRWHLLQFNDLYRVVPPDQIVGTLSPIIDVVFDMQEEFALACQAQCLSVYSTEKWLDNHKLADEATSTSTSPLVRVRARGWHSVGFGFSAAQFLSSSLHLIAGYHRAPVVDIFDLEEVDENTYEPQQRFSLTEGHAGLHGTRGGSSTGSSADATAETVCANDVVAVTEHVSLAALSSGCAVWLDRRTGAAVPCTGKVARVYNIGQQGSRASVHDPLTAAAFLCRDSPVNVLCGTQSGAVQLWDVRCVRECIAVHQTSSTICRLQPSYASPLRGAVWLNNHVGEVQGINVGHSDIRLIAESKFADAMRTTAMFRLPLPRLSVLDPPGLIAFPHLSSNSLMLFDVSALREKSLTQTAHKHRHRRQEGDAYDDDDGDNEEGERRQASQQVMAAEIPTVSSSTPTSGDAVQKIVLHNVMNFAGSPNISACGMWTKYGRLVVGDAVGGVRIA
ncbi:uncharacterized protein Tco025E_00650 [Trypanosoma conorhini]|uniref:Guanine nucleotide-binding protein subunit beta-like protein n=1 Tax=Trypanosoma conorhini TaxID=83891 RepID=A0A422QAY0_9TRYP|nr:uncharacterized protein Tco025E_00650 [Trypanosoma conorhini]RNF27096.1 hypothetical protein Tco025E_00650 [Trypanosoma conorhini]